MRAMRRAERVIYIKPVAQRSKLFRERIVVPFFFRVKTKVLEQEDVAVLQLLRHLLNFITDAVVRKFNRRSSHGGADWAGGDNFRGGSREQFAKLRVDRRETVLIDALAFRTSQMRRKDHAGPMSCRVIDGRKHRANARIVVDLAVRS